MIYLKKFELLDEIQEHYLFDTEKRKIFNSYYPVGLFSTKGFKNIIFSNYFNNYCIFNTSSCNSSKI